MKLVIEKTGSEGRIVSDATAATLTETHRIVEIKYSHVDGLGGIHFVDVWGGTWRLDGRGETICTVGAMDQWA